MLRELRRERARRARAKRKRRSRRQVLAVVAGAALLVVALLAIAGVRAAERRDEADLRQLDALLARREQAWDSGDAEAFVEADATLHLAVVATSHNEVLTTLYADLGQVLRDFLRADVGTELRPADHLDHARLVAAIRAGDASRAAAEARTHAFHCRFRAAAR